MRDKVIIFTFFLLVTLPLIFACAPKSRRDAEPSYTGEGYTQTGIASWYGVEEHGRKAASGERFSMYNYTAAHRSLPMDTMVRVTNLENGLDVIVRINDRGPFVHGRIIDLSYAAAKSINMISKGTAKVKVDVISSPRKKGNYFDSIYTVQIGSFNNKESAFTLKDELSRNLNDVRVEPVELDVGTYYRVRVGRFRDKDEAEKKAWQLRRRFGYRGNVILE